MPDAPVVHIGENSPEQVAFRLMDLIRMVEDPKLTRDWILDTYAECLQTVRDANHLKPSEGSR